MRDPASLEGMRAVGRSSLEISIKYLILVQTTSSVSTVKLSPVL
jgi:hypothetical protein